MERLQPPTLIVWERARSDFNVRIAEYHSEALCISMAITWSTPNLIES
jgi:hypothetical protein